MKRKLFLAFAWVIALTLMLTIVAFADSVHNENTVDYSATVTLDDGTVCKLFDDEGNALIWYISGTDGGKNVYASIRADDSHVLWNTKSWGEVTAITIVLDDETKYNNKTLVVVNMMDDDVVSNAPEGGHTNIGNPITSFKWMFSGASNLEYVYLRLDTNGLYQTAFQNCSKLKYINLEDLTQLARIGNASVFGGCTSLFDGQVLDLTKTKIEKIDDGDGIFEGVPIKGIRLPKTLWRFTGSSTFKNCTKLEAVYLTNKISQMGSNVFAGCTALKAIFYVGTEAEFDSFLSLAETAGNTQITDATKISYTAYKALSNADKASKMYLVYDFTSCVYGDDTSHEIVNLTNACVGTCDDCGVTVINHVEKEDLTITINYSKYTEVGEKVIDCNHEGCTYQGSVEVPAIFTCLGYSVGPNGYSLKAGFIVDVDALGEYKELYPSFTFGIVMANAGTVASNQAFFVDGKLNTSAKGVMIEVDDLKYITLNVDISSFTAEIANSLNLVVGIYTTDAEGNVKVAQYIDADKYATTKTYSDMSLNAITFNQVREGHGMSALVPQAAPVQTGDDK